MFDNLNGTNLQYTIRPIHEVEGEDDDSTWNTDIAQPRFQEPGPRFSPKYASSILFVRFMCTDSIIEACVCFCSVTHLHVVDKKKQPSIYAY